MRVLHVIPTLEKGGAERLVLDLAAAHQKNFGVEVKVAVLENNNQYADLADGIELVNVNSNVELMPLGKDKVVLDGYERLIDEFKPDIIHSHLIKAELITKYNIRSNIRYITHWHGYHYQTNAVTGKDVFTKAGLAQIIFIKRLRKLLQPQNISFLAISNHIKDYLEDRLKVNSNRISVIYNGFDDKKFHFDGWPVLSSTFNLVSIGSFHPIKGQEFLIEVMKVLKKNRRVKFHLTLLGDGPTRNDLEKKVKDCGVEDMVTFTGIVHNPEKYLHSSNLYVHSAHLEGFGLVIIEAMGCGLPVIITNGGGNAEIVRNGHDGYVIENRNVNQFAEKVTYIANNPGVYKQLCENSLESSKSYSIDKFSENIYKYYKQILA